jgi:alpha-tubulin suppressor-like RCC1 family protein
VRIGSAKYKAIAAGRGSSYALRKDGSLWAWGINNHRQLGLRGETEYLRPTRVHVREFVRVTAGIDHALAIESNGTLWGWGRNYGCRVGDKKHSGHTKVLQRTGDRKYKDVHAYGTFTVGIDEDNNVWVWGIVPASCMVHMEGGIPSSTALVKAFASLSPESGCVMVSTKYLPFAALA